MSRPQVSTVQDVEVPVFDDPHAAERMGEVAQRPVRDLFLGPRHLSQYVDLLESVLP